MAVILLAITVAGQAVHAKASHYSRKSPESVYFSASVKIANLAQNYSATPEHQAILPVVFAIREQRPTRAESSVEPGHATKSRPITLRLLRSPPETL
ncbi:MAG TPA: hypothetical protein VKR82_02125 [Candidatus Acidoferrales bacterium]|nr:hypothetical protein [Candidatus Acidoferrales bacterium]